MGFVDGGRLGAGADFETLDHWMAGCHRLERLSRRQKWGLAEAGRCGRILPMTENDRKAAQGWSPPQVATDASKTRYGGNGGARKGIQGDVEQLEERPSPSMEQAAREYEAAVRAESRAKKAPKKREERSPNSLTSPGFIPLGQVLRDLLEKKKDERIIARRRGKPPKSPITINLQQAVEIFEVKPCAVVLKTKLKVAKTYNVSTCTIQRIWNGHHPHSPKIAELVNLKKPAVWYTPERCSRILKAHRAGKMIMEIAKIEDVSELLVSNVVNQRHPEAVKAGRRLHMLPPERIGA